MSSSLIKISSLPLVSITPSTDCEGKEGGGEREGGLGGKGDVGEGEKGEVGDGEKVGERGEGEFGRGGGV